MNRKISAAIACAFAWAATPADATVFAVSYTGTINIGVDATIQNGTQVGGYLFQRPETDLAGLTLAIVLEFDTANATPVTTADSIEVTGGYLLGTPATVTGAYFEINGRRVTLDPSGYGRAFLGSNGTGQYMAFSVRDPIAGTLDENTVRFDAGNGSGGIYPSYSFDNSFSFTPDLTHGGATGTFRDIHYDASG